MLSWAGITTVGAINTPGNVWRHCHWGSALQGDVGVWGHFEASIQEAIGMYYPEASCWISATIGHPEGGTPGRPYLVIPKGH